MLSTMDTNTTPIAFRSLPLKARNRISRRQRSYIDEFTFFERLSGNIEAWYAGELLAVWDGIGWKDPGPRE